MRVKIYTRTENSYTHHKVDCVKREPDWIVIEQKHGLTYYPTNAVEKVEIERGR